MRVSGTVASGKGDGSHFTELDWVKKQFVEKFGFEPFPGTLNVLLKNATNRDILEVNQERTVAIEPPEKSYCKGIALRTTISSTVMGAIIVPQVPGYSLDLLEIVAPMNLRGRLHLKDGDTVTLEF
jgi:CTP-dependent riboflavin kinase